MPRMSWTINGGAEADTVNVQTIDAVTTVNGDAGDDTVNVGTNAPAVDGTVNQINALLNVSGDDGDDTLNVDDSGDNVANTGVLTSSRITGLGMGSPDQSVVNPDGGITYDTLEAVNISLGTGADVFTIESTHTGATTLNANAGADTVYVQTIDGPTTVNAGVGGDTINVHNTENLVDQISALLTVSGDGDGDTLNVIDTDDADDNTGALSTEQITGLDMMGRIAYDTLETLNILLGSGDDHFTIQGTHRRETRYPESLWQRRQ